MRKLIIGWMCILVFTQCIGQESSPEATVRAIYDMVSTKPNEDPDWNKVRNYFHARSTVAMRVSKDSSAVFTLDEWVDDFKAFIVDADIHSTGFNEDVVHLESWECGNIALVTVIYTSSIPTRTEPRKGLDSFHLIRTPEGWKVLSIINEIPNSSRLIPAHLEK